MRTANRLQKIENKLADDYCRLCGNPVSDRAKRAQQIEKAKQALHEAKARWPEVPEAMLRAEAAEEFGIREDDFT